MRTRRRLAVFFICAAALLPSAAHAAVLSKPANDLGLAAYWSFNDAAGTLAGDSSGNKNNGTLSGTTIPSWVGGKYGSALSYDGSSSYLTGSGVSLGNAGASANVTISAWVKLNSTSGTRTIFTKGQSGNCFNYGMTVISGSLRARNTNADWSVSAPSVSAGTWHHLVIVYDSTGATGYVDGVAGSVDISGKTTSCSANNWVMGVRAYNALSSEWVDGAIDDVRVYNRALSAAEVVSLYTAGAAQVRAPNNLGLIGSWNFDEGVGTIAGDTSGSKDNGTLSGSTLPAWVSGRHGDALNFDGSSSRVNLGSVTTGVTVTVAAWIKTTAVSEKPIFSNRGSGLYFGVTSGKFFIYDNSAAPSPAMTSVKSINDNQWHYVVWTSDGSNSSMYIDGVLDSTEAQARGADTGTAYIGWDAPNSGEYFSGSIDDVRVYSRTLSAAEVAGLYKEGATQAQASSANLDNGSSLNNGLVGLWTFDGPDVTDKIYDRSGYGDNGYTGGAVSTSSMKTIGKLGQALKFDGTTSYVVIPDSSAFDMTDLTVAAWIKINGSATGDRRIVDQQGSAYWLLHINSNILTAWLSIDGISGISKGPSLNDGQWHFVAISRDTINSVVTWWVDGVSVGTQTSANSSAYTISAPVYIGSYSGTSQFFPGAIDDVRIYNRALSAAEIQQLYLLGK